MVPIRSTRTVSLLLVVAVLVTLGTGAILADFGGSGGGTGAIPQTLVEPRPADSVVWPYTSDDRSPADPKLALNVVVHGDAARLRSHLTEEANARWNETTAPGGDTRDGPSGSVHPADRPPASNWADADGADRFVYVHEYAFTERVNETVRRPHRALALRSAELNRTLGGQWVPERFQLHDGAYFGARDHLRGFESPYDGDEWVAIQAHSEHWDWFRLRHTVDGIDGAQERLESELMGRRYVGEVRRVYFQNDGGPNSDGWVTVADLRAPSGRTAAGLGQIGLGALVAGALGLGRSRRRSTGRGGGRRAAGSATPTEEPDSSVAVRLVAAVGHRRVVLGLRVLSYGLLFGSLVGLYLFVRAAGIALEHRLPALSPKFVAGSLYLLLAVGLPICADRFGRGIPRVQSFALAATGIAVAVVADYAMLAITVLPIEVVLHRTGVAVALGLIAAGAASGAGPPSRSDELFGVGVALWVLVLALPLLGWL